MVRGSSGKCRRGASRQGTEPRRFNGLQGLAISLAFAVELFPAFPPMP